jgi:hypothetical protein
MIDNTGSMPIDQRFGFTLFARVARVLEDHGYELPDDPLARSRALDAYLQALRLMTLAYEGEDVGGLADRPLSPPGFTGDLEPNTADIPIPVQLEDGTHAFLTTAQDLVKVVHTLSVKGR